MSVLTAASVASLYDALFLNGGFTIMTCPDGSTYTPVDGYAVSVIATQHTIPAAAPFGTFADLVRDVTGRYPHVHGLGGWLDDGVIYIDPVEIIADREAATGAGSCRQQRAIFDLATRTEIAL